MRKEIVRLRVSRLWQLCVRVPRCSACRRRPLPQSGFLPRRSSWSDLNTSPLQLETERIYQLRRITAFLVPPPEARIPSKIRVAGGERKMDHHHPQQQQQQQYGDTYRTLVPSPQPDHLHALQYQQPQLQPPQATPPPHHHASLASHFHLLHLVTRLGDAIGTGTRDQTFDALVEELTSQFARCQKLLNSISGTLSSKSIMVEGQRQSLEETRQLLGQRKDLITKYRSSMEDLLKGDTIR